jgi:GNAT superfamily N-acetyltransferase
MAKERSEDIQEIVIRPIESPSDWEWLATVWRDEWGGETMVSRGVVHELADQAGYIAWQGENRVGSATYFSRDDAWELTSLNSFAPGQGVGTALLRAVEKTASSNGVWRLCLITTNDNVHALRFYQQRGYRLVALHAGSIDGARKLKRSISQVGNDGIPIHDEIELEKRLT